MTFFQLKFLNLHLKVCDPVSQEIHGSIFWWGNNSGENKWYTSNPTCFDEDSEVIRRFCEDGYWDDEPDCHLRLRHINLCPEGFSYYKEKELCFKVMENQTFPPNCPYPHVVSFYVHVDLISKGLVSGPVWLPARRTREFGIGGMIIVEATEHYGDTLHHNYIWRDSINKDCLVYHSKNVYEAVDCDDTYKGICAYFTLYADENNYCARKYNGDCFMSDFDVDVAQCLCRNSSETCGRVKLSLSSYGENVDLCPVEFPTNRPFSSAYNTSNTSNTSSWLDKNLLNYNTHLTPENFNISQCSACQNAIEFANPEMSLKIDRHGKQLVLTIVNPGDLFLPSGCIYPVFCFSDTTALHHTAKSTEEFTGVVQLDENTLNYYFRYSQKYPGYYWCEAFSYPNVTKMRTGMILVIDAHNYGNEYAGKISVKYRATENPTSVNFFDKIYTYINYQLEFEFPSLPFYLRLMNVAELDEENLIAKLLVHVTSKVHENVETELYDFQNHLLHAISQIPSVVALDEFRNVIFCLSDITTSGNVSLHWPLTRINITVLPDELCLSKDGSPVTRTCSGDFLNGANWSSVNGSCSVNPPRSPVTDYLHFLSRSAKNLDEISAELIELEVYASLFNAVDVHYLSQILENIDVNTVRDITNLTKIINIILKAPKHALQSSQDILNSTDRILHVFDLALQSFTTRPSYRTSIITKFVTENVMVFIFDARQTNITGLAVSTTTDQLEIVELTKETNYNDLLQFENVDAAVYIPEMLLSQIDSLLPERPLMVSITLFLNDNLFNEEFEATRVPNTNIFGVLLPRIDEDYAATVSIIYNRSFGDTLRKCGYWHYGSMDDIENIKGRWEEESEPVAGKNKNISSLNICEFSHTTHFALLLLVDLTESEKEELTENDYFLYLITTIESSLSIFGIFGILMTFVLFKPWRQNKGNQMLVQFSIVTLLQIILLYISSDFGWYKTNKNICITVGALLHFVVLSQFCWMLVMAILHYKRFVLVFSKPLKWILLKACCIAYILPLFPVIIHVSIFKENYAVGNTGMCYPTGDGLYIGVIIPGLCIVLTNLFIFVIITYKIFRRNANDMCDQDYILALKLRLVFVLFFMLGITWVFGFMAEIFNSIVFIYLFCTTSSIQGFITFLAFIVCNENTRNMYKYLINVLRRRFR